MPARADTIAVVAGGATLAVVLLVGAASRPAPRPRPVARPHTDTDVAASPSSRVSLSGRLIAAGLALATAALALGPVAAAIAGLVAVGWRQRRRIGTARAAREAVAAALPDAIELLVLCVHAGRSPTQAVVELTHRAPSAVRPGFVAVERQLHRGVGLADALAELPRQLGPGARELAATIATTDREGLPLTPALDRLAADARADRRRQGEAAVKRLPVRLSFPLVTCVLPAFVLLALAPAVLGALSSLRGTAL